VKGLLNHIKSKADIYFYFALFAGIVLYRIIVLLKFATIYTDSDQTIMWYGLKDYSSFVFHEPRFYGQSYNTMIEAFFAIPLFKMGLSAHTSLSIITASMAIFPFIFLSILCFKNSLKKTAIIVLCVFLFLPVEYSLITSLSRGFVTGIFIASFSFIVLFGKKTKLKYFIYGFCLILSYSVNPNSLLITLPIGFYILLVNYKCKSLYIYAILGSFIPLFIHILSDLFYIRNPNFNLHKFQMEFAISSLFESFNDLNKFFNYVSPIFWKNGFISLLLFVVIGVYLYFQKSIKEFIIIIFTILLILITLGISKVHDGTNSIFFSYSRMYLSIPLLFCLFLIFIKFPNKKYFYFFPSLALLFMSFNLIELNDSISEKVDVKNDHIVGVVKIEVLENICSDLKDVAEKYDVDLILISNHWHNDLYNYGCPILQDDFPFTIRPKYERRTWKMIEAEKTSFKNILVLDVLNDYQILNLEVTKIEDFPYSYLIKNNTLGLYRLLEKINIQYRQFKVEEY
jgi:hypothetical protein